MVFGYRGLAVRSEKEDKGGLAPRGDIKSVTRRQRHPFLQEANQQTYPGATIDALDIRLI